MFGSVKSEKSNGSQFSKEKVPVEEKKPEKS